MRSFIRKIRLGLSLYFFDPFLIPGRVKALLNFWSHVQIWRRLQPDGLFRFRFRDMVPMIADVGSPAGGIKGHYFFQDIWAARIIAGSGTEQHIDVGSSVGGFVAHLLSAGIDVRFVDIRPLEVTMPGLTYVEGSIVDLPFESGSVESLSCLHVIEHIGLGRYGDIIDPDGHVKAVRELVRVLSPGGRLLVGVPIGRERLCFNAHRVFNPVHFGELFSDCDLISFSGVPDSGDCLLAGIQPGDLAGASFACGLYQFEKRG